MKKTFEKSQQQAEVIKMIALPVMILDVEYCREASKAMADQARQQESMSVLNPSHPQIKNDILRIKAKALATLCDYVDTLREVDKLEKKLKEEQKIRDDISGLFL